MDFVCLDRQELFLLVDLGRSWSRARGFFPFPFLGGRL